MFETIILLFCFFITILYIMKFKRPKDYPPGPSPSLFVGNVFHMPKGHFHSAIESWARQYGPVVGFSIFNNLFIAVTGVKAVLEALRKEEFQSRPDTALIRKRTFGKLIGIFFSSGPQWTSSRKFVVKYLRSFGRTETEHRIADEINELMDTIKDNSTVEGTGIFGMSAVNVIWSMIANSRIDISDEASRNFLKNLTYFFRQGNPSGADIFIIFPILQCLSSKQRRILRIIKETQGYIRKAIQEHREVLDPENPIDLIDHYLVEMEKGKSSSDSYFSEEDLIAIGVDLFSAGSESTSNSVEFVLLYMVLYPDVQQKMQEELDYVLGRARKPVLDDRTKMHYTMAVISEVERLNSIAPVTPMHCCTQDTEFFGYFIPKGTQININLHSLGNDPEHWEKPEEFNPKRFLNDEGKFTKSPILHPFGLGQRICVGEMLARNSIFLFTTTFFDKYSISLPFGEPRPSTDPLPGFTTAPRPFKMHITSRY